MVDPAAPPPDATGVLGGADLFGELSRWAAAARADAAAAARTRERWLRQQADEEATVAGVLLDLAERRCPAVLHTSVGRRHRGIVVAVGADFCAVRTDHGSNALLAIEALTAARPDARAAPPQGDREVVVDLKLAEALAGFVGERPRLLVIAAGKGEAFRGELRAVGQDMVTLRLDGDPAATVFLPVRTIAEVILVSR